MEGKLQWMNAFPYGLLINKLRKQTRFSVWMIVIAVVVTLLRPGFVSGNEEVDIENPCVKYSASKRSVSVFPDPRNPNGYLNCDSEGRAVGVLCPVGFRFSPEQSACVPRLNAGNVGDSKEERSSFGTDSDIYSLRCRDRCVHGRCIMAEAKLNTPAEQCLCDPGYEGSRCERRTDMCLREGYQQCGLRGICRNEYGTYVCLCKNGKIGANCDDKSIDNPCTPESISLNITHYPLHTDFEKRYIKCIAPYTFSVFECPEGERFDPQLGRCVELGSCSLTGCMNGGQCIEMPPAVYSRSDQRFQKRVMATSSSSQQRESKAHFEGQFRCRCKPGFTGPLCENKLDFCLTNPCKTGRCESGLFGAVCVCPDKMISENCESGIENPCNESNNDDVFEVIARSPTHENAFLYCHSNGYASLIHCPQNTTFSKRSIACDTDSTRRLRKELDLVKNAVYIWPEEDRSTNTNHANNVKAVLAYNSPFYSSPTTVQHQQQMQTLTQPTDEQIRSSSDVRVIPLATTSRPSLAQYQKEQQSIHISNPQSPIVPNQLSYRGIGTFQPQSSNPSQYQTGMSVPSHSQTIPAYSDGSQQLAWLTRPIKDEPLSNHYSNKGKMDTFPASSSPNPSFDLHPTVTANQPLPTDNSGTRFPNLESYHNWLKISNKPANTAIPQRFNDMVQSFPRGDDASQNQHDSYPLAGIVKSEAGTQVPPTYTASSTSSNDEMVHDNKDINVQTGKPFQLSWRQKRSMAEWNSDPMEAVNKYSSELNKHIDSGMSTWNRDNLSPLNVQHTLQAPTPPDNSNLFSSVNRYNNAVSKPINEVVEKITSANRFDPAEFQRQWDSQNTIDIAQLRKQWNDKMNLATDSSVNEDGQILGLNGYGERQHPKQVQVNSVDPIGDGSTQVLHSSYIPHHSHNLRQDPSQLLSHFTPNEFSGSVQPPADQHLTSVPLEQTLIEHTNMPLTIPSPSSAFIAATPSIHNQAFPSPTNDLINSNPLIQYPANHFLASTPNSNHYFTGLPSRVGVTHPQTISLTASPQLLPSTSSGNPALRSDLNSLFKQLNSLASPSSPQFSGAYTPHPTPAIQGSMNHITGIPHKYSSNNPYTQLFNQLNAHNPSTRSFVHPATSNMLFGSGGQPSFINPQSSSYLSSPYAPPDLMRNTGNQLLSLFDYFRQKREAAVIANSTSDPVTAAATPPPIQTKTENKDSVN